MRTNRNAREFAWSLQAGCLLWSSARLQAQQPARHALDLTVNKPESVGFSSERLERCTRSSRRRSTRSSSPAPSPSLRATAKSWSTAPTASATSPAATPMTKDTIFRDYSMTKPVTGVAMMILYEQGKWLPIRSHLQIHSRVRAPQGLQGCGCRRQNDPRRSRSRAHHARAMTHTAGFTYGIWANAGRRDVPRPRRSCNRKTSRR